jgi:FtsP/CotA-like multicopper oxidase with cupredoxin domain
MLRFLLLSILLLPFTVAQADTLHLNPGNYIAVNGDFFPAFAWNATSAYLQRNMDVQATPAVPLSLTLINHDTVTHGFAVDGYTSGNLIPAGGSITLSFTLPSGVFIYYDDYQYPRYEVMGAAGMIVSGLSPNASFFATLSEFQSSWNLALATALSVDFTQYTPDFFTVNGFSYPDIDNDSTAHITGMVGDTLMLYVANTGRMAHSLHFHGYHLQLTHYSGNPSWVGRWKDTVPLKAHQTMTLMLIPDKPGMFPLHDHNALSLTAKNMYPFGMRWMMEIQ